MIAARLGSGSGWIPLVEDGSGVSKASRHSQVWGDSRFKVAAQNRFSNACRADRTKRSIRSGVGGSMCGARQRPRTAS